MLHIRLTILLVILFHFSTAQNLNGLTKPQWLEDFDKLAYNIKARHVNPYMHVTKEQYDNKITNLGYSLDELTVTEKLVELMHIANFPGDGKTAVDVEPYFNYYPVDLFWFDGGLRIDKITNQYRQYAGWKIKEIDGKKIAEATAIIQQLIPSGENLYYKLKWDQRWLRNADLLHIQGITASPTEVVYTLEDDYGKTEKLTLKAISFNELNNIQWAAAYLPDPRFTLAENKDYSIIVFDEFTVYMNLKKYPSESIIKEETAKLLDILENQGYTHLVIDIRGNDSSSGNAIDYLIKKLSKSDFIEHGIVYVITDRDTFGQAFLDIFKFKEELGALTVGEPPAQNPNGFEIGYQDVLPHSKIKYTIAGSVDKLQEEEGNTLIMYQLISPHFQKRKDRVDEVMDWIALQP